jgi:acyl-CoA thioesterase
MPSDVDFFGLIEGGEPGRYRFTVADHLTRLDGRLYGGTAIGVSVAVSELVSDRSALWMTTQFVSTVEEGAEVDVVAEVLAAGKRTNQVRVTATAADGEVIFASLGATGRPRTGGELDGVFEQRPEVTGPDDSARWTSPFTGMAKAADLPDITLPGGPKGFALAVEMREPEVVRHPEPGPGRTCLWVRRRDGEAITPAVAAYLADMVPMSICRALGVIALGTSLDNTIRIGSFVETEWLLIDLRPHLALGGYGHGAAHVWSESGHLLATASQTASLVPVDAEALRNFFASLVAEQ